MPVRMSRRSRKTHRRLCHRNTAPRRERSHRRDRPRDRGQTRTCAACPSCHHRRMPAAGERADTPADKKRRTSAARTGLAGRRSPAVPAAARMTAWVAAHTAASAAAASAADPGPPPIAAGIAASDTAPGPASAAAASAGRLPDARLRSRRDCSRSADHPDSRSWHLLAETCSDICNCTRSAAG